MIILKYKKTEQTEMPIFLIGLAFSILFHTSFRAGKKVSFYFKFIKLFVKINVSSLLTHILCRPAGPERHQIFTLKRLPLFNIL